jgi:hypothetical protein
MAKRKLTEEQRAELRARLARGRERAAANRETKRQAKPLPEIEDLSPYDPLVPRAEADAAMLRARRDRLLGGLDPETAALFSDEELETIEREEHKKAGDEKKKQALADVRSAARQRERVEQGLIASSVLLSEEEQRRRAEKVRFRMRVPGDGAGLRGQNGIRTDGHLYQDGQWHTVPRVVWESLMPNIHRAYLNEMRFKTLDQHKPGQSAEEVLSRSFPNLEVTDV